MKCCICDANIENYGNNPFPLISLNDYESRCCDFCNELVINARIIQMSKPDSPINVGDQLVIFYSDNSEEPTNMIKNSNKFLSGFVETIIVDKDNSKKISYKGSWGRFTVNSETDSFTKI